MTKSRLSSTCSLLCVLVLAAQTLVCSGDNSTVFEPEELIRISETEAHIVTWSTNVTGVANVTLFSSDENVVPMDGALGPWGSVTDEWNVTYRGTFNVSANFLGYSTLNLTLLDKDGEVIVEKEFEVSVILLDQVLSSIFSKSLGVLLSLVYINMGATIDLTVIKKIVKRPIGPLIGVACQYIIMPLLAFGISQLMFKGQPLLQLGMFLAGCCPGGGASNMWTHLLGGKLDLSITMTFTSTIFAFVALPAWILALGPVISAQSEFTIPFGNIALLIVYLLAPCAVGLLTQRFLPKVARFLKMTLTPFSIFNVLYISTFGIYANKYIFRIIDAQILLSALALPLLGYIIGLVTALLLRQPRPDAIAISVETGIQNTTIALFILNLTLELPAASMAVVVPGCSAFLTPLPLLFIFLVKTIYGKVQAYRNPEKKTDAVDANAADPSAITTKPAAAETGSGHAMAVVGVDNPALKLDNEI